MTPKHGTYARYQAERKVGAPCDACRDAARAYMQTFRARRSERERLRENARQRARSRAAWRLASLHRDEYALLVAEECLKIPELMQR